MNVALLTILFIEITTALTHTEAAPWWNWDDEPKQWSHHHHEPGQGCAVGLCVKKWECPKFAVVSEELTGSCLHWNYGPWVCCGVNDVDTPHREGNDNTYSTQLSNTNRHSKNTAINSRNIRTRTVGYRYDGRRSTPYIGTRNSNSQDGYTQVSFHQVTRFTTSKPPTKRTFRGPSTKRPWTWLSQISTKATSSTIHPKTVSKRLTPSISKTTVSTKPSSRERKNSSRWGNHTTGLPNRSQTKRNTKNGSNSTRTVTRTTSKQSSNTTPLPNVNTRLCGIRDQRFVTRRQRTGGYNSRRNPIAGVGNADAKHSNSRLPFQRIVGGEEAEPFSWPWVAALYKVSSSGGNRFLSAGSLINENFVLTAAHVFTPDDLRSASYVVMLGTHDAQDALAEYTVCLVLLHPKYEHRYYYNDIALLKLERKVIFNDYIMPVCLPSHNTPLLRDRDLQGKNVTVMGWGDDSFGGKSSRVLKEATFPIVSSATCNESYVRVASNRFPKGITNNMLCAGDPNGGKDACQGDSGGPLTVMENGRYTQVGIVSFGYKCGDKEFPGVYTKVAPYLSWIANNTKQVQDNNRYNQ